MFAFIDIYGYLGRDPEFKRTPNGKGYVQFSVGVSKKDSEKTQWFSVKGWTPYDEVVRKLNLHKGSGVYIRGSFELNEYNGKQYPNVSINLIEIIGSEKKEQQSQFDNQQYQKSFAKNEYVPNNIEQLAEVMVSDEDLPF